MVIQHYPFDIKKFPYDEDDILLTEDDLQRKNVVYCRKEILEQMKCSQWAKVSENVVYCVALRCVMFLKIFLYKGVMHYNSLKSKFPCHNIIITQYYCFRTSIFWRAWTPKTTRNGFTFISKNAIRPTWMPLDACLPLQIRKSRR